MTTFHDFAADEQLIIRPWQNDENVSPYFREFLKYVAPFMEDVAAAGKPMSLECFMIEDSSINAFAAAFGNVDTIAVNSGVFPIIHHTATALTSQRLLRKYQKGHNLRSIRTSHSPEDIAEGVVSPTDAFGKRYSTKFSRDVSRAAVMFILLHEFTHIRNGHLEYVESLSGVPLLPELHASGPLGGSLERETLEWDADCFAIDALLGWALEPLSAIVGGRTAWKVPRTNSLGSEDYALTVVSTAVSMVMFYFAENSGPFEPAVYGTHPHPRVRIMSASSQIMHVYAYRTGHDYSQVTVQKTVVSLACWYEMFEKADRELVRDTQFWIDAHISRIDEWTNAWARIHDQCDAHKRGGALAPKVQSLHPAFPTGPVLG